MHWILQHNISTDEQRQRFVDALDSLKPLGATWSFIKLIPFVGDVEPDDDYTGKKVFALGSTSLIAGAKKRIGILVWYSTLRRSDTKHI